MPIKQTGIVLLTGLVFLLFALMAAVSTLKNINILHQQQGDDLKYIKRFYYLENVLIDIENQLFSSQYALTDLPALIKIFNIYDASIEMLPIINGIYLSSSNVGDIHYRIEFLGSRNTQTNDQHYAQILQQSWLFRIRTWQDNHPFHRVESLIEIFPSEIQDKDFSIRSKRIAWFEGIWDE